MVLPNGFVVEVAHNLKDGARALGVLGVQPPSKSGDGVDVRGEALKNAGDLLVDGQTWFTADDLPAVQDRDRLGRGDAAAADGCFVGFQSEDCGHFRSGGDVAGQREVDVLIDGHAGRIGVGSVQGSTISARS
jgi:hypothetical protein